jgi:hypothetical protein
LRGLVFGLIAISLCFWSGCGSGGGGTNTDTVTDDCSTDNAPMQSATCTVTLTDANSTTIMDLGATREVVTNSIPEHPVGLFPNTANPHCITVQMTVLQMTTNPTDAGSLTALLGATGIDWAFGVALNGVEFDPVAAEPWAKNTANQNWSWVLEATANPLGLDCNNAHVQPTGKYHYHGTPSTYIDFLGVDGSQMVLAGYAADGFPIYWKFGDIGGNITELMSSYQLRTDNGGMRPGDGVTAPDGAYDGTYVQDYEYVPALGHLDACNGMTGPTPSVPGGEYYYVVTEAFPGIPRYFKGTPDASFAIGP